MNTLYSIGYVTKPIAVFIAQLKQYAIDAVANVRLLPYSKVFRLTRIPILILKSLS